MKILFINPPGNTPNEYPPLGLLYLASVARKSGYTVDFFDAGIENNAKNISLEDDIIKFNPDVCALSLYTTNILEAFNIIRWVKTRLPKCKVVVGGHHATALPERTMKECQDIDYLVYGEGEETFVELLNAIDKNYSASEVRGIFYRANNSIRSTEPREYIEGLDSIPFPAFDLSKDFNYPYDAFVQGRRVGVIVSSRGCPYKCVFCNRAVFKSKYRRRSPGNVVAEMKYQIEKFGVDEIYFMDDLFAINRRWLNEFYLELEENAVKVPWKCLGRVDILSKEDFVRMRKNGCYIIQFGVESGNDKILEDIKKHITVDQARRSFKEARDAGLHTHGFFIFGHRKDDNSSIKQTLKFAQELNPPFISFFLLVPFPGTEVYSYVNSEQRYDWDRIKYYHFGTLPISVCKIDPRSLVLFADQAFSEFYGRMRYLWQNLFHADSSLKIRKMIVINWKSALISLIKRTLTGNRIFKRI